MDNPVHGSPGGLHSGGFNLVEFSTRRRVTIAMMTITLVLFGVIALGDLKVNLLPDLSHLDRAHRIHRRGALRNRDADQRAG
jgi:hydrophobic/amphiphilic exporter-1 (mainly G- bacteria), HAE1 family